MGIRLNEPNDYGGTTDHSIDIELLRYRAAQTNEREFALQLCLAADLLEAHDQTGIFLDNWLVAREFVERLAGPIIPNGV